MSTRISDEAVYIFCSFLLFRISAGIERKNVSLVKTVTSDSVQLSLKGAVSFNSTGSNITLYRSGCKDLKLCKQDERRLDRFDELIEWGGLSPSTMYKVIVVMYTNDDAYTINEDFKTKSNRMRPTKSYLVNGLTTSHLARSSNDQTALAVTSTEFRSFSSEPSKTGTSKQQNNAVKGLIWWVAVVGGAGLGVIILLSILTVLFYMPWRRQKLTQLRHHLKKAEDNMYDNIKANADSQKMENLQGKNGNSRRMQEKVCVDDERYQKTQSAVSWGTNYDTHDANQDGAYANTDFLFTQSSNSPTSNC